MDRKYLTVLTALTLLLATVLLVPAEVKPAHATGPVFAGTIFFTQFIGSVGKVSFTYDPSIPSFTLAAPTILNGGLPEGADGLVFDPQNGNLLVGSNAGPDVKEVDPVTGSVLAIIPSGTAPFHMMVDANETTAWTSPIPGTPASIPLKPLGIGTAHPLTGDDTAITTIAWQNETRAFYTSSGGGGFGHFGTIDLKTFTTTCAKAPGGGCQVFPAAHGMTFDPFTKTVIIFGDSHVTQINPSTLSVVSDLSSIGNLDQGTVDGHGHLYVACNCGLLFFEDYAASGHVGTPTLFTSMSVGGLCCLDDVAPLVPPGAAPGGISVSKFFTDSSLNPLLLDSNGNPAVNVTLASGVVRSTNPGQVLAWVNVTNTAEAPLQSLKLNETLPVDWKVDPAWMPALGAIHVYFANTTSLATNPEITQPSTIKVSTGNPEAVIVSIPSLNATVLGHPLMPGQSVLLSVKLTYGLIHTSQSPASYPRNYTDTASAAAWSRPNYMGIEASGTASASFIAYAKVVG